MAHAILSPSSAHRWLTCTPSARFEQFQADESSDYAEEGTLAHELAGLILESRAGIYKGDHAQFTEAMHSIEWAINRFYERKGEPSAFFEMLGHAEDYAEFALSFVTLKSEVIRGKDEDSRKLDNIAEAILVEGKLNVFDTVPLGFGTSDCGIITKKVLYVTDYKYGAGVRVSAVNNTQGKLYALGSLKQAEAMGFKEIETIVINIFQPRAGGSSTWQISKEDLTEWAKTEVQPKAQQAIAGLGEFVAGGHCQFCKAKAVCGAFYDMYSEFRGKGDPRKVTDAERLDVIKNGKTVRAWITQVENETTEKMVRGERLEGYKVIEGRSNRAFKSETLAIEELVAEVDDIDKFMETKLLSLTAIEKVLGKKEFNRIFGGIIIQTAGKPTIVEADDDRPAIVNGHDDYED